MSTNPNPRPPSAPQAPSTKPEPAYRSFVADSHFEAVRKVQAEIGLDALVVNTRTIPVSGISRLWKKPKIELVVQPRSTAPKPESVNVPPAEEPKPGPRTKPSLLNIYDDGPHAAPSSDPLPSRETPAPNPRNKGTAPIGTSKPAPRNEEASLTGTSRPTPPSNAAAVRCEKILRKMGLDEILIVRICDEAAHHFEARPTPNHRQLLDFCRRSFSKLWHCPRSSYLQEENAVVLVGAPGCGKSTVIGKWASLLSLGAGLQPRIWKLDGLRANTDDMLDCIADLHQIPVERIPEADYVKPSNELLFIDLPGIEWTEPSQIDQLRTQVGQLPRNHSYLVLNAAYNIDVIKRQIRAFSVLPLKGLILTHLDEESRWSKILNISVGTNYPLHIVSGGQNIPGYFQSPGSEEVLSQVFPDYQRKSGENNVDNRLATHLLQG